MSDYLIPSCPVRFEKEGNPHYPLPPDYPTLSQEGKRLARINALCLQETPDDYVHAWAFMRNYYLDWLAPGTWYKPPYFKSPPAHYKSVYDRRAHQYNAKAYPREFGKSILMREQILLDMLTHPFEAQLVFKASDLFVKDDFLRLQWQLENNQRLVDDFGILRPKKGSGAWSTHMLVLSNGFRLIGQSIMAASSLGGRYTYIWLDDVEYDPQMKISPTILTENTREFLNQHVLPMLSAKDGLTFQGTLLNRKIYLYKFTQSTVEELPQAAMWNRKVYGEIHEGAMLWPDKWDEEKLKLERVRLGGEAAFQAQRMNNPGSGLDPALPMHQLFNYYSVGQPDEHLASNPLLSEAELVTWLPHIGEDGKVEPQELRRPFGETVTKMQRFLLVDPKHALGETTDFACVMVIGIENTPSHRDTYYVLDMVLDRTLVGPRLLERIWSMGRKWAVRLVGVEAVGLQRQLYDQVAGMLVDRSVQAQWMPKPFPILYKAKESKEDRIGGLAWRFEQYRIKYPKHLAIDKPWSDLLYQTENFTPDGRSLPYDDAIDTVAMIQYVIKPQGNYKAREVDKAPQSVLELLEAGQLYVPGTRIPLAAGLNASELTSKALDALWRRKKKEEDMKKRQKPKGRSFTLQPRRHV